MRIRRALRNLLCIGLCVSIVSVSSSRTAFATQWNLAATDYGEKDEQGRPMPDYPEGGGQALDVATRMQSVELVFVTAMIVGLVFMLATLVYVFRYIDYAIFDAEGFDSGTALGLRGSHLFWNSHTGVQGYMTGFRAMTFLDRGGMLLGLVGEAGTLGFRPPYERVNAAQVYALFGGHWEIPFLRGRTAHTRLSIDALNGLTTTREVGWLSDMKVGFGFLIFDQYYAGIEGGATWMHKRGNAFALHRPQHQYLSLGLRFERRF